MLLIVYIIACLLNFISCTEPCTENEFGCDNKCIPLSKTCDGQKDCSDNTDELICPRPCARNEFGCDSKCIPLSRKCNRHDDCLDGTDEMNCTSPCDPTGSLTLTTNPLTGYCNCKENTAGRYCNQCKANTFYLSSNNIFGCIKCFCMGVTEKCFSSSFYRHLIAVTFIRDSQEFKIGLRQEIENIPSQNLDINSSQQEIVFSSFTFAEQKPYYWSLPQRFLGNKVTSYGGVLNYTVRYILSSGGQFSRNSEPDVEIISENNGIRLFYFNREPLEPNSYQSVSVPLLEQHWQRVDGQSANREHLLMVLADLKAILVKASYTTITTDTREVGLQSVVLEIAEDRNTGQRRAYEVEECRCPSGYRGSSCEECDVGFHRVDQGLYLGLCEPCNCYGHSKDCDVATGNCLNCANHTAGDNCERCKPGYIGNPATGEPCKPPTHVPCQCDHRGSSNSKCTDGNCTCKVNVVGFNCDLCRPGTFDLQEYHERGCLECYCFGATGQCQSSNLFVTQIPMPILGNHHGFTLTNNDRSRIIKTGFKLHIAQNKIGYDYITERGQLLFWSLPPQFTGNKITSYGGSLTWTQEYAAPLDAILNYYSGIVIVGDGISIFWTNNIPIALNTSVTTSIKLEENYFVRVTESGRQKATRSDLLRVLSSIEAILIRASYASQTSYVYISNVSLDTAVSQPLSTIRATQVEICKCPFGYKGFSCESCIVGFYQTVPHNGYGKECQKCPCNDHEESCALDSNFRMVCKCKPGYTGEFCEDYNQLPPPQPTIEISVKEPLIQIVAIGDTVRYTCKASSLKNKPVSVKWSRVGGNLPEGRAFDYGVGIFVLINAVASDSGTYQCTAFDGESVIYQNVSIKVEDTSSPRVVITPETPSGVLEYNVGDVIMINCEAVGTPIPNVEWNRDNDSPVYKRNGVRSLVFRIASANKEDEGTYYCRARNNMGSDIQKVTINIRDGIAPKVIMPQTSNGVLEFSVGDFISIECKTINTPSAAVKWSRKDGSPIDENINFGRSILRRISAKKEDAGTYNCQAWNIYGSDSQDIIIYVKGRSECTRGFLCNDGTCIDKKKYCDNIPDCPDHSDETEECQSELALKVYPEQQIIKEGDSAIFLCRDESNVRAQVYWARGNGLPLPQDSKNIINKGRLEIPNIKVDHAGTYLCKAYGNASNFRHAEAIAYLQVKQVDWISIPPIHCNINESTCQDGSCIPNEFVCNNRPDCPDGSDEISCS